MSHTLIPMPAPSHTSAGAPSVEPAAAARRPGRARRPRLLVAALLAALAVPALASPAGAQVPVPGPAPALPAAAPAVTPSAYATSVLAQLNTERRVRGLRPLIGSACVDRYADAWSSHMARSGTFQHQSLLPMLRGCTARRAGENIAYGNVSPAQMMQMWMNSPGHRANILNPWFTHIGVGAARDVSGRWYATQSFATLPQG